MVTSHKGGPSGPKALRQLTVTFPAPGSIVSGSVGVSQVTVAGLRTTDVIVGAPTGSAPGGLGVSYLKVVSANLLEVTYINQTSGGVDPGSAEFQIAVLRFS